MSNCQLYDGAVDQRAMRSLYYTRMKTTTYKIQKPHIRLLTQKLDLTDHKDRELITKAYHFAEFAHEGQKRASGEPYFNHVFATGLTLAELGMSPTVVAAGLLHDTIEDTQATEADIDRVFGKEILFLVNGVTKLGKVKYRGIERNVENLRKFFISMAEDLRVIVIKLADRLHNVRTLEYVRPDKRERIALETLEIYAPLANRLGIGKLKGWLEDAAFPYAYPKEFEQVTALLGEQSRISEKYMLEVERALRRELRKLEVSAITIDHRLKHLYSLYKKLKKYDMDIDKIYDIMALRIIVSDIEECYRVLGVVHGLWKPLPGRIKDYIATPKPNGYKSLHTTIFTGTGGVVEIQIRTQAMHAQAEYGIASHFTYKEKLPVSRTKKKLTEQYAWVEELREAQREIANTNKFVETLKMDFFKDRVFVFTPNGDIIDLPEDSSVIDFAYAVHTDIGDHASGAHINGKFNALGTKLKNSDIVEIIVKKETVPSSKWLTFAKTTLARNKIQKYLKEHSLLSKFLSFGR